MERKNVLLDLDGTLLPIDIDEFLKGYFYLLGKEFSDLWEPDFFIDSLMKATHKMIANNGKNFNMDVFKEAFFQLLEHDDKDIIMDRFEKFYLNKFPTLQSGILVDDLPVRLIATLKEKGYNLVLATNPLFPLIAIEERLRWAKLDIKDFSLITTYENMHYCKPNPEYYLEITKKIQAEPSNCIMIGNDVQEDMIATAELGMKTFLVNDYLIDRKEDEINVDWQGSLEELVEYFS
ncbi:HAD family hydrolase [Natronospora cellulosivora (SeqCode)]